MKGINFGLGLQVEIAVNAQDLIFLFEHTGCETPDFEVTTPKR
jgi:hypothetical protein